VVPLPAVEGLFEGMDETGVVREGAMQAVDQVPPVERVGSPPAVVSGEGLDPIGAIPHQEEMLCMAEAQAVLACQEEPFAKVLGAFDTGIAYPFQEPVAAVFGGGALQSFAGGEDAEAEFKLRPFFALSAQEGSIDFGQDDLPRLGIPRRDFSVGEDGLLLLVFIEDKGRPGVLR